MNVEETPYTIECTADDADKDAEFDPMTNDNWFGTAWTESALSYEHIWQSPYYQKLSCTLIKFLRKRKQRFNIQNYHVFFCCRPAWAAYFHHNLGAFETGIAGLKWETSKYFLYLETASKSLIQSWYWVCKFMGEK